MTEPGLDAISERLQRERPVPTPGFRGDLRRRLSEQASTDPARPRKLGLAIAAYAGSGTLLWAVAALGLAGVGPLAS